MDLTDRWNRWCGRFDEADREVGVLFHTRQMWLATTQMWTESAKAIKLNGIVQNHFIRQHVSTQCVGIRRECDDDSRTSSVQWCLKELVKFPDMVSRSRFEANVDAARQRGPNISRSPRTNMTSLHSRQP